jgi:hypothetical protein
MYLTGQEDLKAKLPEETQKFRTRSEVEKSEIQHKEN